MSEPDDETMAAVAGAALPAWDLGPADLTLVARSENVVFRADTAAGDAYAVRVHRQGYHTLVELESEAAWTTALAEAGLGAPPALPTTTGAHYAEVAVPGTGETRLVGVIPWFAGTLLEERIAEAPDPETRDGYFRQLGALMAAFHDQAVAWTPPDGFVRHGLDRDGFVGEAPFWGRFWEVPELSPAQRSLLVDARHWFGARLSDYGTDPATFSMIHADLRSANVLVHGDRVHVIDFDDAGFGWHMYDVAVALSDHATDDDFDRIRGALIGGYRSRRPLGEDDLAQLPTFLALRAVAGLGWLHDRPEVDLYAFMPVLIEVACGAVEDLLA